MSPDIIKKNTFAFFFIFCLVVISCLFFYSIKDFVVAILITLLLFRYFNELHLFLIKRNVNQKLSAALVVITALVGIVLPITIFTSSIYSEFVNNYKHVETSISNIFAILENSEINKLLLNIGVNSDLLIEKITANLDNFIQWSVQSFSNTFLSIIAGVFNLLIILYLLYFLCLDGKKFFKKLSDFIPLENEKKFSQKILHMTDAVFLGVIVIAVIEGLVGGLILYFFGVKSFIFWSVVMMVCAMLPLLGTNTILIPFAIYQLLNKNYIGAILIFIIGLGGSTISQNIVKPKIIGNQSGMHPAFIILSTLGGIASFGVVGIFLGPIICALFLVFWEEFTRQFFKDKNTMVNTNPKS